MIIGEGGCVWVGFKLPLSKFTYLCEQYFLYILSENHGTLNQ